MEFRVLGPVEILESGSRISVGGPKQRTVLAVLVLHVGKPVSIDRLIESVWGEEPPSGARRSLQTYVSNLRSQLGDVIHREGEGYVLDVNKEDVDWARFEDLVAAGSELLAEDAEAAARMQSQALDLWRGSPYADIDGRGAFEAEITRLEELHLTALQIRNEAELALGRHLEMIGQLDSLASQYPLHEGFRAQHMVALYRAGRQVEALRAYRETVAHLAEIGVEPSERLRRLEERILLHDKTLTQTRNNLPVELSSFIGREDEKVRVGDLLTAHRLVTLVGAGGSGKTRLAVHVARSLLDRFPDGVWFVELTGLQDPELVPTEIARTMGLKPKGEDVVEVLAEATASETILVVLDNCEHLLEGSAATAHRLLQSSPELKFLATSREPLRVPGEAVYEIPGMSFPSGGVSAAEEALEYEAVELFEQRARQVSPSLSVDRRNLSAVVSICRRLDGMPLAIELAAARTGSLPVEVIAERLDDQLQLLTTGSSTAPPRQQTLQATIEWSYLLLDRTEKAALNRLSVFRGGFQLDAAEQVISGAGIAIGRVTPLVSDLADKSLVTTYETRLGIRYRVLETVRQYAAHRLRESADTETIKNRHQLWCLVYVDDLWQRAVGVGRADLAVALELEADNLQAALEWSRTSGDDRAAATLSQALAWHWYFTGHLGNAITTLRAALEVAGDEDVALIRALLARCLAYSEDIHGAILEAESAHLLVPGVATALGKAWIIASVQLAYFMSAESDPELMLPLAEEAADVALGQDDVFAEILARQVIADAYCWNGRTKPGLEQQRIALDQAAASGDAMTISRIYGRSIYNYMLDPESRRKEPLLVTEEWMSLVQLDPDTWTSTATDWLPWVYMQVGDFDRADQAVAWMGNRTLEGYNRTIYLIVRSSLSWMRGDLREAHRDIEELKVRGVSQRWAHTYYPLAADVAADRGSLAEAREIAGTYLARTVHPTGEAPKLGVLNPLVRAEVDAAIATDSNEHIDRAHRTLAQMRRILDDHPPRVESWTSVMTHTQNIAFAEAEITRISEPSPDRWVDALEKADYVYYQLYARWRLAEALFQVGERQRGTTELAAVHGNASRIGAKLLRARAAATAHEFEVRLG